MRTPIVVLLLAAGCSQPAPVPSAPIAMVGQTNPNGNAISLNERGLGPTNVAGPTAPRRDRQAPTETVEVIVRPDDPASKKPLAWYLTDENTTLTGREVRKDGSIVYHFLRPLGSKTPGDSLEGVRVFATVK